MSTLPALIACGLLTAAPKASLATCDNQQLLRHAGLLVIAPHPDDEVLGFGGLIEAYRSVHLPVTVVVVSDGDAECSACAFWRSGGTSTQPCRESDLREFALARHRETREAIALLGNPAVTFLGYPDQGIGLAWSNLQAGHGSEALPRLACEVGDRPLATGLTAETLLRSLRLLLEGVPATTLIATSDRFANHPDHAALATLVAQVNQALAAPRPQIDGMIHPPAGWPGAECAYPPPAAVDCGCFERGTAYFNAHPGLLAADRAQRLSPFSPAVATDRPGIPLKLCVAPEAELQKQRAIEKFATQIGSASRDHRAIAEPLRGLLDCTGYLNGFVRSTELFWPTAGP